mgnify:CR=1 FL=1
MDVILRRYADLLVNYSLALKEGEKLYVRTSTLAEPLVREVYRSALSVGALVEVNFEFREQNRILLTEAREAQLRYVSPFFQQAIETFDAYLYIRAPFNLREEQNVNAENARIRQEALKGVNQTYFERTASKAMRRNLCQYPTIASAQEAGMSLEEYEQFVYQSCKLFDENPTESWLQVRRSQQPIVDYLNKADKVQYKGDGIDITFSTKERIWINSDGQGNMPSGEVFSSPIEDSVNGVVRFSFPAVYMGHEVEDVTLWVTNGYIEKWEAKRGKELLDQVFQMEGTRRFGEVAIGTNYSINRFTKNILFDEKIGGTIHMAIGQSYLQTGGKNQSPLHWDMIADMRNGGEILVDEEKIYENGQFLI